MLPLLLGSEILAVMLLLCAAVLPLKLLEQTTSLTQSPKCARWCHLEDQGLSWMEQNSVYYASGPAQANIGVKYTLGDLNTCISIENLLERI